MAALKVYTDEGVPVAIAIGLRRRGAQAWSAHDAGNLELSDLEQLEYACREQAAIFTHDHDFLRLAHGWLQQGREHWGIFYVHRQRLSMGECIGRVVDYVLALETESMKNQVVFL